jgi:hypothetical protein
MFIEGTYISPELQIDSTIFKDYLSSWNSPSTTLKDGGTFGIRHSLTTTAGAADGHVTHLKMAIYNPAAASVSVSGFIDLGDTRTVNTAPPADWVATGQVVLYVRDIATSEGF